MKKKLGIRKLSLLRLCICVSVLITFNCTFVLSQTGSQPGSHKYTNDRLLEYNDSLMRTPYPYALPFLGKKAQAKGIDLQRPFGVMLNLGVAENELTIDRLAVSTDDINYTDVTGIVNFTKVLPRSYIFNVRPDVWLLPFLNVSGLVGYYTSETEVVMNEPADMKFLAKNTGNLLGIGVLAAGGVGPLFVSYQFNGTWSFSDKLFNSTFTSLNGIRIGYQRKNHRKPQTALNIWLGVESLHMSPHSRGALNLTEAADMTDDELQQASEQWDAWYEDLSPPQKIIMQPLYEEVSGMLNDGEDAYLYYDFDKSIIQKWNLLVGAQYQINKNLMLSSEGSFIGSRWRFVFSTIYRFGIKSKHK